MRKALRVIAPLEALSLLCVLVSAVVKRTAGSEAGVKVFGPIHGLLFLLFAYLVIQIAVDERWKLGRTLVVLGMSVIPFGGFWVERKVLREEAPVGAAAP